MNHYEVYVLGELKKWQAKMVKQPRLIDKLAKKLQVKLNSYIPDKVHSAITTGVRQMCKLVLFGSKYTTGKPFLNAKLEEREQAVLKKIKNYRNTAAAEGGLTGAGGILLGLADFPLFLSIKIKLLFEIASLYGFDVMNYKERVCILYIFQLTFCSDETRLAVYELLKQWQLTAEGLPADIDDFDWRPFQQEYRDYLDIAKMAQLMPVIGAPVGVLVNYQLVKKLGHTAMNVYRMRLLLPQVISGGGMMPELN